MGYTGGVEILNGINQLLCSFKVEPSIAIFAPSIPSLLAYIQ